MSKAKFKLVRLDDKENEQVEETARRLGLSSSEVLRRSFRIAIPRLQRARALGVKQEIEAD